MIEIEEIIEAAPLIHEFIDWSELSKLGTLSEKFILKFKDRLNWNILCARHPLSAGIVDSAAHMLRHDLLSTNAELDKDVSCKLGAREPRRFGVAEISECPDEESAVAVIKSGEITESESLKVCEKLSELDYFRAAEALAEFQRLSANETETLVQRFESKPETRETKRPVFESVARHQPVSEKVAKALVKGETKRQSDKIVSILLSRNSLPPGFVDSRVRGASLKMLIRCHPADEEFVDSVIIPKVSKLTRRRRSVCREMVRSALLRRDISSETRRKMVEYALQHSCLTPELCTSVFVQNPEEIVSKRRERGYAEVLSGVDWRDALAADLCPPGVVKSLILEGVVSSASQRDVSEASRRCKECRWTREEIDAVTDPVLRFVIFDKLNPSALAEFAVVRGATECTEEKVMVIAESAGGEFAREFWEYIESAR
jgi:hypothetical protein